MSLKDQAYYLRHKEKILAYQSEWRANNKATKAAQGKKWAAENIGKKRALARKYTRVKQADISKLKEAPCTDCGKTFPPECMDFDHVKERGPKLFNIAARVACSPKVIAAEIAKCDLVCSNCHRIRTRQRREMVVLDS